MRKYDRATTEVSVGDVVRLVGLGYGVTGPMTEGPWEVVALGPRRAKLRPVGWYWHKEVRVRYEQLRVL